MTSSSSSSSSSSSKTNNGVDTIDITLSIFGGIAIAMLGCLNWMLFHEHRQSERGTEPGAWTRTVTQSSDALRVDGVGSHRRTRCQISCGHLVDSGILTWCYVRFSTS